VSQFAEQVAALSSQASTPTRRVRLWAGDESRFGLLTIRRRRITARGLTSVGPTQMAFDNFWLYGAVCPAEGLQFTQPAERLNRTTFQSLLDAFAQTYAETLNIRLYRK
jgi:hypothetical protein